MIGYLGENKMAFNNNPFLEQVMSGVDMLVQDTEQKRRETKAGQMLTEKRGREDTLLKEKRTFSILENVIDSPDEYTEGSVSTATQIYDDLLKDPKRGLGGFIPKLRPRSTKEVEQKIDPKIAISLNMDPNTTWTRTEREMLTARYESERKTGVSEDLAERKFKETRRHNIAEENRKRGGSGFFITVGGNKYSADKALDEIIFYEEQADKLFLSGYKGTSKTGTIVGTQKVTRDAYEEYKTKLDTFKKAIKNDLVTPEMLQEIDEIKPFIVDEKGFVNVDEINKNILNNSGLCVVKALI